MVAAADDATVIVDVVDVDVVAMPLQFVIQYNRMCSFLGEVGSVLPPYVLCIVAGSGTTNDIWECLFSKPTNPRQSACFHDSLTYYFFLSCQSTYMNIKRP